MRRKDREVTGLELLGIIDRCDVCRIALSDSGAPYIVPMNFGYDYKGGKLTLYFHCANEGRKLDIIERNNKACFEMDCSHELITADAPCGYSYRFESVVGNGIIEVVHDGPKKAEVLRRIMKKYAEEDFTQFDAASIKSVTVLILDVEECTGKRHL